MKTVILAGGLGTRLAEHTDQIPKPMVEIGGRPILWHILNLYAGQGFNDFIVACGYKAHIIKEYFANFRFHDSDFTVDVGSGEINISGSRTPDWRVTLADTGLHTQTGGRLRRLKDLLDERFMLTYGDGLSDVDLSALINHHAKANATATLTAVHPPARFGGLTVEGAFVTEFNEKPQTGEGRINGGFMVMEPEVFRYLEGDSTILERDPLVRLAQEGQLAAHKHDGFWQPMDTLREKNLLESLWQAGNPPWLPRSGV